MKKKILLLFMPLVLYGCYITTTDPVPNPAGFHQGDLRNVLGNESITALAYGTGTLVAVTYEGRIAYSQDEGRLWTLTESDTVLPIKFSALAWGEGFFLAGGDGGKAAVSQDGVHWERGIIGPMSPKDIYGAAVGVLLGRKVFVVTGNDGRICYSQGDPQGHWELASLTPFGNVDNYGETIRTVCFGKVGNTGLFVAAGDNGKIAFTNDLSGRWYGGRTGYPRTFYSLTFGKDRFLAVGEVGTIKYSSDPTTYLWTEGEGTIFGPRNLVAAAFDPLVEQFVVASKDAAVGFSKFGKEWKSAVFKSLFQDEISALTCTDSKIILGGKDNGSGTIRFSN